MYVYITYLIYINKQNKIISMNKLINILLKETTPLRDAYIQQTEKWAKKQHSISVKRNKWTDEDWCKYFNITPHRYNSDSSLRSMILPSFPKGFYSTKNARSMDTLQVLDRKIIKLGAEKYAKLCAETANKHYMDSINKLAMKIESKGLDIDKLKATSSHIGKNFDTTLTDGTKTVRAFTIVASGEVQRPHYRYLIK